MRDYDGFIRAWNTFGVVPDKIREFGDLILERSEGPLVELGSGNGLLAAYIGSHDRQIVAVDKQYPPAVGNFQFIELDGNSNEFFDLLCSAPEMTLVGRRSLCLFYTPEWMKELKRTNVKRLIIQSLEGEKHLFNSSEVEEIYLKSNGWTTERTGKYIVATR